MDSIVIWSAVLVLVLPISVAVIRTWCIRSTGKKPVAASDPVITDLDVEKAVSHLQQAIRFRTISQDDGHMVQWDEFQRLQSALADMYPLIHQKLRQRVIGKANLVYIWEGSDPTLEPAMLSAHQDVVPPGDGQQWTHAPFSGDVADGYVWGRGSFDAKGQLVAIMEGVEILLAAGFQPRRTWWMAFGCDEEVRGPNGARQIASTLVEEHRRFAFVLDEGGVVAMGMLAGLNRPVATIGIVEKGNINLKLTCIKDGGHSSTPMNPTSLGIIAAAVARIENSQMRARFTAPVRSLFNTLGEHTGFPLAVVFLNLWLFSWVVVFTQRKNRQINALLRTTHAATMAQGSEVPNAISTVSTAMVNFRLLPGTTEKTILSWVGRRIHDKRISLEIISDSGSSRVSDTQSQGFRDIKETISAIYPCAITTAYMMTGGTDALWYEQISDCVYRFTPAVMDNENLARMHNVDERFSIINLGKAVQFYIHLIQHA